MKQYKFTFHDRVELITRMYQDHSYTVDEIVQRLRYSREFVETVIQKVNSKIIEKK
jgi:hypothetical protein